MSPRFKFPLRILTNQAFGNKIKVPKGIILAEVKNMEQRVMADKLLDLSQNHGKTIAEQWYKAVTTNPRTSSFRKVPKDKLIAQAEAFFANLKQLYFSENPYREVQQFLERVGYVEYTYSLHIPLHENIYALIMMRRHIWLYAETQAMFNTSLDMWQAVESINRTLLLFDYTICILAQKYAEKEPEILVTPAKRS